MPTGRSRRLAITLRPARIGVLVAAGPTWRPRAMRMLESFSRKWGGAADVLVPVTGEAIPEPFVDLLAEFDPDWLGVFVTTYRYHQMADPPGFEKWLDEESKKGSAQSGVSTAAIRQMLQDELDTPRERYTLPAALEQELLRRLAPFRRGTLLVGHRFRADCPTDGPLTDMLGLQELPGEELHQIDARAIDEDLDLMLAMRFGAVAPRYEQALSDRGVKVVRVAPEPIDAPVLVRLAFAGYLDPSDWGMHKAYRKSAGKELTSDPVWAGERFWASSAFGWTAYRCGWRQYLRKLPLEWPYALVVGDEMTDFALGMLLQRLTVHAMWVPAGLLRGTGEVAEAARHETIDFLDDWSRRSGEEVHVVSTSLDDTQLGAVVDELRRARYSVPPGAEQVHPKAVKDLRHGWPHRLYEERPEEIRYEPFEDGVMVGTLSTPQPSVSRTDPDKVTWEVEVRIDDLHYPVRTAVSEVLGADGVGGNDHVRSGAEATTYHSHTVSVFVFAGTPLEQRLARPRLRAPRAEEVFHALLAKGGLRAVRSNAGRFADQTLDRFGGLDDLIAAVRSPVAGRILQAYRSRAKSGVEPGDLLDGVDRRFLSIADMAKVAKLNTPQELADLRVLVDGYVTRRILRRGLSLQCPVCRYAGWFRLADLDEEVQCQRCRSRWPMTWPTWKVPPDEPSWQYELDEVVFQSIDGNVAAPVLVLDQLRGKSRGFLFAPEMDVYEKDAWIAEVDLWVIVDGKIIVGEAKTTDELAEQGKDANVAARLFRVAHAATADELVVATTEPAWRPRSKDALVSESRKWPKIQLRVMEGVQ